MTKVVNKHKDKYDVYIGRGSLFGNPYVIGVDGTREEVIEKYAQQFNLALQDPIFKKAVLNLKGKTLGCFCKPQACHGDVIVKYINEHSI